MQRKNGKGSAQWTSRWFVLEGIDGGGKTETASKLVQVLKELGYNAAYEKEPSEHNAVGVLVRCVLQGPTAFSGLEWGPAADDSSAPARLYRMLKEGVKLDPVTFQMLFTTQRNEYMKTLEGMLRADPLKIVVADRCQASSIAYVESHGFSAENVEYIKTVNSRYPMPELMLVLDLAPQTALDRVKAGRHGATEHFEELELLERIRESYLRNFPEGPSVKYIDASRSRSEVLDAAVEAVIDALRKNGMAPK